MADTDKKDTKKDAELTYICVKDYFWKDRLYRAGDRLASAVTPPAGFFEKI